LNRRPADYEELVVLRASRLYGFNNLDRRSIITAEVISGSDFISMHHACVDHKHLHRRQNMTQWAVDAVGALGIDLTPGWPLDGLKAPQQSAEVAFRISSRLKILIRP
jgi:hypothetical protein